MAIDSQRVQGVLDCFHQAAQANEATRGRRGCTVRLQAPAATEVLIGADLHGHRLNYRRLLAQADLERHCQRHLVLQEVCHGGPLYPRGRGCMSHLLLEDVAALKLRYPQRVHFLLSNHELAELLDLPITKASRMLNLSFRFGLEQFYGEASEQVRSAAQKFIRSCPLAVRLSNRVLICHSAPDRVIEEGFDAELLDRALQMEDLRPGGDAFRLVWGRDFREANAAAFAKLTGADVLIHGHEPCEAGFQTPNSTQIILDSSGSPACCLLVDVTRRAHRRSLLQQIRYL